MFLSRSSAGKEAAKRSSVFEAAAALVQQHGTASSGMAVTREEFEQWCKLSGFGPHPMSAREWRALCKRARESQRRRVPAVWRAVLLERRVGPQNQTSSEPKNDRAACMAAAELQEVLRELLVVELLEAVDGVRAHLYEKRRRVFRT